MRVGFVGLGKLGLPVALAIEAAGHKVYGWDEQAEIRKMIADGGPLPYQEVDAPELLADNSIIVAPPPTFVDKVDLVLVAVQTPHQPEFEGITRLPEERADFNYDHLCAALVSVDDAKCPVVVISTVLPGTMGSLGAAHVLYNPFFIAMGTTIPDFRNPEFVLVGTDGAHPGVLRDFYATIHDRPVFVTTIKTAELTKVAYNTFIGLKIAFANTMMELCEKTGADVDDLVDALSLADRRLLSPAYLRGGMGDGGGCFPPGELVVTASGPKPIQDVRRGDLVLTGDGTLQPVIKTWERYYEGDLVSVKAQGLLEAWMTEDHPVIAREDMRGRYENGRRRTDLTLLSEPAEVEAGALREGVHRVTWPRGESGRFPLPPHATREYLELAGWWLSEGSGELSERRGRLRFDLHFNEIEEAQRIGDLLVACAPERTSGRGGNATLTHKEEGNRRSIRFGSKPLTEQLVSDFGKGAASKRLPPWVLWGDEETAALVLSGLLRGDAHIGESGISYSTVSPDLALGALVMMTNLGCVPAIREISARPGHQHSYEVRVRNRRQARMLAQKIDIQCDARGSHEVKDEPWRPVRRLTRKPYSGPVHNLWVGGSNTYVVASGVVHNCHPRDNIALSWLAREVGLSFDLFDALMVCRERQTEWLAKLVAKETLDDDGSYRDAEILGKAYKPETNLTVGSPATLLSNILTEMGVPHEHSDPFA